MAIIAGLPRFIGYVLDLISCLDIATYPLHLPLAHIMGIYDMRMPMQEFSQLSPDFMRRSMYCLGMRLHNFRAWNLLDFQY